MSGVFAQYNLYSVGRMREEICLLKHELSYQCGLLTAEKRVIGVGGGGGIARAPSPFPLFGRNLKKEEDYYFTVENTEWITQRNSPFDFTEYVVTAKF